MSPDPQTVLNQINRRSFLSRASLGLGATALASLAKPGWMGAAERPSRGCLAFPICTQGQAGDFFSAWLAGRPILRRSITSRAWPSSTASRCRSRSPMASRLPSCKISSSSVSAPFSSFGNTASPARKFPTSSPASPGSRTTSPSCARCTRTRSTTTLPTR